MAFEQTSTDTAQGTSQGPNPASAAKAAQGLFDGAQAWKAFGFDLPMRLSAEMLAFAGRRLQAQAEHVAALGRCTTAVEAVKLQTAFAARTLAEYQREAGTLSQGLVETAAPHSVPKAA
ncbi:phasin family protein [Methylobacterium sp. JK268]